MPKDIYIIQDTATPYFRRLTRSMTPSNQTRLLMRWGARVRKTAIENALAKGGRRFWKDIARSINLREKGGRVTVGAWHVAAAQKQYGGVIRAKGKGAGGADYLTIPISEEAEGQSAAKFALGGERLFAIKGVLGYSDGGEFHALFALRKETRPQEPDPFFPEPEDVADMGEDEAVRMVERV